MPSPKGDTPAEIAASLDAGDGRALTRATQKGGYISLRVNAKRRRKLWDLCLTGNDEYLTDLGRAVAAELESKNA